MNNLTEKELNLDLKTIFFGEEIPALSFEREDDEIRLDLCESGISFDNTGCNGTPFISCSYEEDDDEIVDANFYLYFSGDNCPEDENLDEDMTLGEAIELIREKYLDFQKEEIDYIFEGLDENDDDDDESTFQDDEGYYIDLIVEYNSGKLSEELTKYFDEKMKEYNVDEIYWDYNCFGNKTVYIKLNA